MKKRSRLGLALRSRLLSWLDPDTWLPRYSTYYPTDSGVNVTAESAMRVTTVFACVRIISWTLASLPLPIYRRLEPRGKERATDHPLYALLHDQPNSEQTSFDFRALLQAHALLYGNGYAEIEFNAAGQPVALWPIPAWKCKPRRVQGKPRDIFYEVSLPDGKTTKLKAYQVLHIRGLGLDGLEGMSPIGYARQAIGLTLAAEEFGARFFGQGANVGGVASHPNTLSDQAYKHLTESLQEKHEGLGKSHRILLLEEGMKYEKVGIPPNEAQFLETRRFQVADIARIFGVPSHMVNDTERTTSWGTGIEEQGIGFVVYTLRPWLVNWEQQIKRRLLFGEANADVFAEHLVDGLLRGNMTARYAAYAIGRQWGWLSADDVSELENRNPLPDGQGGIYLNPMNMVTAQNMLQLPAPDKRMQILASFRRVLEDAGLRILRREEADVVRQARKLASRDLGIWLEGFYREHQDYVQRQLQVPVRALVEAAGLSMSPDLSRFAARYTERNYTQLAEALPGPQPEALQQRFDDWQVSRPTELAAAVIQYALEGRLPE